MYGPNLATPGGSWCAINRLFIECWDKKAEANLTENFRINVQDAVSSDYLHYVFKNAYKSFGFCSSLVFKIVIV